MDSGARSKTPVAIIGGGFAGLTAANYLRENRIPFVLFEASDAISGLASSFRDEDGFSYDLGAHFVTNRLVNAIGVGDECLTVRNYGERIWLDGKSYSYPFGLITIPRMARGGIRCRLVPNGHAPITAADWFRRRFGAALADEIALPLIEAWSGAHADDLAVAVGDSLPKSIAKTLYLKTASRVLGRAVACGYSRELPESPSVFHVYPKGGVATLCEKLAEDLNGEIKLESPVTEILVEKERVVAVSVKGKIQRVSSVISTAPVNILAKVVRGTHRLEHVKRFRYRPMVFVNLKFEGRGLLPDTVLWVPEKRFPFFRLTEATLSMPWLAPVGKTMILVDIGCEKDDRVWNLQETELVKMCLDSIAEIIPDAKDRYLGCRVLRTPIAYPVFLKEYEKERLDFEKTTGIDNLLSIGRNGEFAHIFMEDVYWRTRKKVQKLVRHLDSTPDINVETATQTL